MSAGLQEQPRADGAAGRAAKFGLATWSRRAAWASAAVVTVALGGVVGYQIAEVSSSPVEGVEVAGRTEPSPVERVDDVVLAVPSAARIDPLPDPAGAVETESPPADASLVPMTPEILAPLPSGETLGDRTAPPAWHRFAVAVPTGPEGPPMIAIVIDDMGVALTKSWQAINLPAPLTLAYLPYAQDILAQTEAARRAGHELVVHLPMEPDDDAEDPGPNALLTDLDEYELRRRLDWNLGQFAEYVGVSNHMGSRFTRNAEAMEVVLSEVKARGLLFLDSRTTRETVVLGLARRASVPAARRDVFIDNVADAEAIAAQLAALEDIAREHGYAVGIGHPRAKTLEALAGWLPDLLDRGFALVPISAIVARTFDAGQPVALGPQESLSGAD